MSSQPRNSGASYPIFTYRDSTGGCNLRDSELKINDSEANTEWLLIQNMEGFQRGGFAAQLGNAQLNTGVTDTTRVLNGAEYKRNGLSYLIYTKASGKCYEMLASGGAETEIRTGLSGAAIPTFVEYNGMITVWNGVDSPWKWDGTTAVDLAGQPSSWASSGYPDIAEKLQGGRLLAFRGADWFFCAQGNEDDWTTASDAGFGSENFGETAAAVALKDYGTYVAIYTADERVYLFSGRTYNTYTVLEVASNRSAVGQRAIATINDKQYFFTGEEILPLITTNLGAVKLGDQENLATKISPFITREVESLPLDAVVQSELASVILLPYYKRNQLIGYFKTSGGNEYHTAAIYDFDTRSWVFRKATPVTCAMVVDDFLLTGTLDGKILKEFVGNTIIGTTDFEKKLLSPYFSFQQPWIEKEFNRVFMLFKASSEVAVTFNFFKDYAGELTHTKSISAEIADANKWGTMVWGVGSWAAASAKLANFEPGFRGRSLQFSMSTTENVSGFKLLGFGFEVIYNDPY